MEVIAMKDGFIKIACATPDVKVADCEYNACQIVNLCREAAGKGVKIVCFPELSVTGYTCGDLFLQTALLRASNNALLRIAEETKALDMVVIVGAPVTYCGKLYNCGVVIEKGTLLGAVPKENIPNYSEFYEARYFAPGPVEWNPVCLEDDINIYIGNDMLFVCAEMPELHFGIEICEDLWVGDTPSVKLAQSGASLIFNLSCSDEVIGKADYRRTIIKAKSGSLACGYVYCDAGIGESTQDMVFAGHNIIAENGSILAQSEKFSKGLTVADVDIQRIIHERRRMNTFRCEDLLHECYFSLDMTENVLDRHFSPTPFVPEDKQALDSRCEEILTMQAVGLASRLKHIGCKNAILGLSGGLDSTLALIVTAHAFDMLGLDRSGIQTITMPCFGTTDRTYTNACKLAKAYGSTLTEINIRKSVTQHFEDIGQDPENRDVTYENSQARERTQILMDKANQLNGIVVGTGDLSELALGWATYNGDHMSMYGVNASVPKTLVKYICRSYAYTCNDDNLKGILLSIVDTPISPELTPNKDGQIAQKTEEKIGKYDLNDFFLFYMMRYGFEPEKIIAFASIAFAEVKFETIREALISFYSRFFHQQFKRSCLPDGPKVGSVTLSPRGDWRMPSDASVALWLEKTKKAS